MKNNTALKVIIAVLVVVLAGASLLYSQLSDKVDTNQMGNVDVVTDEGNVDESEESSAAPDFTVYDIEGKSYNLSDFKGKPTVVNFWASWCGPCKSEMPDFDTAFAEYGDEVNFLMVNMTDGSRETVKDASSHVQENGYKFPVYYDTDLDAANTYSVYSIPTTYFIDAEGNIVTYAQGAISLDVLEQGLDMIK